MPSGALMGKSGHGDRQGHGGFRHPPTNTGRCCESGRGAARDVIPGRMWEWVPPPRAREAQG